MVNANDEPCNVCHRHLWARIRAFVFTLEPFNGDRIGLVLVALPDNVAVIAIGTGMEAN